MIGSHRRAVASETLVSVAINALVPAAIIRLLGIAAPAALPQLVPGLLLGSGLATLLMTLVVTALVRGRARVGTVPLLARTDVPAIVRWLPNRALPRAFAMAAVAIVVLVPVWAGIVTALRLLPLADVNRLALFNIVFGASVGLTMTPPVVVRALADAP